MTAVELLAGRGHVLLDFDGPVCAVFGGLVSDRSTADRLKLSLGTAIPIEIVEAHDPFDVLRYAASRGPATARVIEDQMRLLEVEAVASSPATPGAEETVRDLHNAGFTITIVSNNSVAAVRTFLALHDLTLYVRGVSARTQADPMLLKPSPFLVEQAIRSLGTSPEHCVMIGDSTSDIEAAHAAGVPVIAYANKPGKVDKFRAEGADDVIESIGQLRQAAISG